MTIFSNYPSKVKPLRIFVVENHADTAKYLCLYLELLGHRVDCAHTMQEALARLPNSDCHLLLCDISLPDGNGWDLLAMVEVLLPIRTCAVAMSGWTSKDAHAISQAAGYHFHLDKPIATSAIHAVLDHAANMLADHARHSAMSSTCAHQGPDQAPITRRNFL